MTNPESPEQPLAVTYISSEDSGAALVRRIGFLGGEVGVSLAGHDASSSLLNPDQVATLAMVASGMSVPRIADTLEKSVDTLYSRLKHIRTKLGLEDMPGPGVVDTAFRVGILTVEEPIENQLTQTQVAVARLIADGFSTYEIAERLKRERSTIKSTSDRIRAVLPPGHNHAGAFPTYLRLAGVRYESKA